MNKYDDDSGYESMEEPEPMFEAPQPRRSQRIKKKIEQKKTEVKPPNKTIQKPKAKTVKKVIADKTQEDNNGKIEQPDSKAQEKFLELERIRYKKSFITREILDFLLDLYFVKKEIFGLGRNRAYYYIKQKYPEVNISQTQMNRFLQSLEITQLFNPSKEVKDIAKTITSAPFKRFELDLVDMSNMESEGYKWMMNFIDTFSKYVISIPLVDKEENTVLKGFKECIDTLKAKFDRIPSTILSDNGSEFINQRFKDYCKSKGITQIFTKASRSSHAKLVERFNGYIRKQIAKYDNQFDNPEWTKYINILIDNYNNSRSRITKKTPIEIMEGDTEGVKENIEKAVLPKNDKRQLNPLKKGDYIRLKTVEGHQFEKPSNNIVWSREVYRIRSVFLPKNKSVLLPKYRIENLKGQLMDDYFYQNELYKVNKDILKDIEQPEKLIVQKILSKKVENGKTYYLIKWQGKPKSFNSWEPRSSLYLDVPKLVKQFDEKNQD